MKLNHSIRHTVTIKLDEGDEIVVQPSYHNYAVSMDSVECTWTEKPEGQRPWFSFSGSGRNIKKDGSLGNRRANVWSFELRDNEEVHQLFRDAGVDC